MLPALVASLVTITLFELGDKSFFVAMILATRHQRRLVFPGVLLALAVMTGISVLLGHLVASLSAWDRLVIHYLEVLLLVSFGLKLLYDAWYASPTGDEVAAAAETVDRAEARFIISLKPSFAVVWEAFYLTFITEWGDRTQIATITLAAAYQPLGVLLGAVLGHSLCTGLAVIGGRMLAGRISERVVMGIGGGLFLIFGLLTLRDGA